VAFISYLGLLTWPMMALGWVTNLIQRGRASLDRLDGIFSTLPGTGRSRGCLAHRVSQRELTFKTVSFAYDTDRGNRSRPDRYAAMEKGETLGLVGPAGIGKTTLMHLLDAPLRCQFRQPFASMAPTSAS
jgi:ATP-binding cassette subfamily B multidrug efflux pump